MSQRPFIKLLYFVPLFLLGIIGMTYFFPKGDVMGFSSFIIAFEFADSITYLETLFTGAYIHLIPNIDMGNIIDFGFMIVYSSFLAAFFIKASKFFKARWLKLGIGVALVICVADAVENIQLLNITSIIESQGFVPALQTYINRLQVFTWIKWGVLAVSFWMLIPNLFRLRAPFKYLSLLLTLPVILLLIAVFNGMNPAWLNFFTLSIFLCFALLLIFSALIRKE